MLETTTTNKYSDDPIDFASEIGKIATYSHWGLVPSTLRTAPDWERKKRRTVKTHVVVKNRRKVRRRVEPTAYVMLNSLARSWEG